MNIRKAGRLDIPFLANLILESEGTGHELYSYCTLFEKSKEELIPVFEKVLDNDFEGHGLGYKNFYLIEVNNELAGGMSFYLEGSNGDSNHLMTGALMQVIDRKELIQSFGKLKEFRDIDIEKRKDSFQLDSVAILEKYRGMGLLGSLLDYLDTEINTENKILEVQVWKNNTNALKAYKKFGFKIEKEIGFMDNGRVLMTK